MYTKRFKAYKDAVVAAFLSKKEKTQLDWLVRPSRARLKKELKERAENGLEKRDQAILRQWLGMKPGNDGFAGAIEDCPENYFRAMGDFMLSPERSPRERSVEMLALLTEFPLRPFIAFKEAYDKDLSELEKEELEDLDRAVRSDESPDDDTKRDPVTDPGISAGPFIVEEAQRDSEIRGETSRRGRAEFSWWYSIIGVVVAGLCAVFFLSRRECMFWDHDRYKAAPCGIPMLDTALITFDKAKLRGFKRVLRTDTMTGYAREHFWYTRVGGHYEVFTARGTHPLYQDQVLRPVSDYIINYCHNHPHQP